MRTDGLDNLILAGQIEGKLDREEQRTTYLEILRKWMAEEELREITTKIIVEDHFRQGFEGTRHREVKEGGLE